MKQNGISEKELKNLQEKFGKNTLPKKGGKTIFQILFDQIKNPFIYILLIVIAVSLLFREFTDAIFISLVIGLNITMGFIQEYQAQKTLKTLNKLVVNKTTVIRNGKRQLIDTTELVPGDIVILGSGDKVPADGKLIEGVKIFINEAILTGEDEFVEKSTAKKKNNLYMGSSVIYGRGVMRVEMTGTNTQIGKIGKTLTEIKEQPTPLEKKLSHFGKMLGILIAITGLLILIAGLITKHELLTMLKFSIILSIAAIPEGLPIAVTVILSIGMNRILKRNGLVKRLLAVETLGSTSVICTDKTGTLTEGVMQVTRTNFKNYQKSIKGLTALNTRKTALELAIYSYLKKELGYDPQIAIDKTKILYEEVFESEKKYALTMIKDGKRSLVFIFGAPEIILNFCKLSKKERQTIKEEINSWAKSGLRVVGLISKNNKEYKNKSGFSWEGLIGITDPVRKDVHAAIASAVSAGIKVKVITGDYLPTAKSVAERVGLNVTSHTVIEGKQIDSLSASELRKRVNKINVFARISPHQKLKIVTALQENGEVVAMAGDGVNDVPALKKADIGVVVGSATDVAKETADLILLDNNFKTIVFACEEGRVIFSNIQKVIAYVLSNSFVEMILIIGAIIMNAPFPLTIIQILWLHLICDGPPDIILGFEPKEEGIMDIKPKVLQKQNILSLKNLLLILMISVTGGLLSLLLFIYFNNQGNLILARTIVFATVGSIDLIYIFAYKNLRLPIYKMKNFFANKYLFAAVIYGFILLFLGIYLPFGNRTLETIPLQAIYWIPVFIVALLTTAWVEITKFF